MNKLNKFLILFLVIMTVLVGASWEILQSKWVGSKVSNLVTNYIESTYNAKIKFDKIEFKFYPPGAEIQNVNFKYNDKNLDVSLKGARLGVYFKLFDVFRTDFIADRVLLDDAELNVKMLGKEKSSPKLSKANTPYKFKTSEYFEILYEVPLNEVHISDLNVSVDEYGGYFETVFLENKKEFITLNSFVKEIRTKKFEEYLSKLDSVRIGLDIYKENTTISTLEVMSGYNSIDFSGTIQNYNDEKRIKYLLLAKSNVEISTLHNWFNLKDIGRLNYGEAALRADIKGNLSKFNVDIEAKLTDFMTDFAYGEKANLNLSIDNDQIIFNKFKLSDRGQSISLKQPFEFFNFKTKKFVEEPIIANVKNLKSDNFLRYLRNSLSILDGDITGDIRFDLYEKSFRFKPIGGVKVNKLSLKAGETLNIFTISDYILTDTEFLVDNGIFKMSLFAENEESNFTLNGEIGAGKFFIGMPTSYLVLDKFDELVGLDVKGKGTLSFEILNNKDNTGLIMKSKKDFKDLSIHGFLVDKIKAEVDYQFAKNLISIKKFNASSSKSEAKVVGDFNYDNFKLNADYDLKNLNFSELKKILNPYIGNLKLTANEIYGLWNSKGQISGVASLDGLDLIGDFKGFNNYFYDENIDQVNAKLKISKGKLTVNNIIAKKGRGLIRGKYLLDLKTLEMDFDLGLYKLGLQDINYYNKFPLSLRGDLNGNLKGSYKKTLKIDSSLNLRNTFVFSEGYDDSFIDFRMSDDLVDMRLNLFKEKILLDSEINLAKTKELSKFELKLDFDNIKNFFGIFSGVDLVNTPVGGKIDYRVKADFDINTTKVVNLDSNLKDFILKKAPINVAYKSREPEIIVKNGEIEKWSLNLRGKRFYIFSNGDGNIYKDYSTKTQLKMDASLVEVFNNIFTKASGNIRGVLSYGNKDNKDQYEAYLSSSNLNLTTSFLPTGINKGDFKVSFRKKKVKIEKFDAQLVSGTLSALGIIDFSNVIPDIDVKIDFDNAGFSLLKKSNLVFSGESRLIGKNFPYTLSGDLYIQQCSIVNEPTEFGFGNDSVASRDIEFLPGQEEKLLNQFLNFNINVVTRNPIYIRNSLADIGLVGNVQLLGGEAEPKLSGDINLAPRTNKVSFKNNEFLLTKANVNFSEQNAFSNPFLDINARSTIGNYLINISVFGDVDNYKLELGSEPTLNQTDILSLIAFGYTEDISNNLTDSEKESMTSAGVGSIIFDSFKINETLKNEFGLQVNLGTEISQDETSFLDGRSADSSLNAGRVRSATTVEVKKKVDEKTSMSLTSTVGASATQKQSININYNLDNNISVEGVYESISTDNAETINNDNSFGFDIKRRWSFK